MVSVPAEYIRASTKNRGSKKLIAVRKRSLLYDGYGNDYKPTQTKTKKNKKWVNRV